jgi:hypothetical protein
MKDLITARTKYFYEYHILLLLLYFQCFDSKFHSIPTEEIDQSLHYDRVTQREPKCIPNEPLMLPCFHVLQREKLCIAISMQYMLRISSTCFT